MFINVFIGMPLALFTYGGVKQNDRICFSYIFRHRRSGIGTSALLCSDENIAKRYLPKRADRETGILIIYPAYGS